MSVSIDIQTGVLLICIVNISFAIGFLLLSRNRVWNGAKLWFIGNLFGLSTAILRLYLDAGWHGSLVGILPAVTMSLANIFKVAALERRRRYLRVAVVGGMLVACLIVVAWLDDLGGLNFAMAFSGFVNGIILGWLAWICLVNRRWQRLRGSSLFAGSTIMIALFAWVAGLRALHNPPGQVIFSKSAVEFNAEFNVIFMLAYVIVSHTCLIVMLMDRLSQTIAFGQMRQRKESRLARQAEAHAREMEALAHEKQSLLEILIHEVRQPLNNAQAALQQAMAGFKPDSGENAAGHRLQSIIDKVVLSLSNAIVGASMLERKSQSQLIYIDIVAVCQLACSDTGPNWEERIDLRVAESAIFANADPILLRLAVRNLVDNAIKHSAAGHRARVELRRSVDGGTIEIIVSNKPAEPFSPEPALFGRGVRGGNATPDGRGLGLFITQEIALLHNAAVEGRINAAGETEFVMTLRS